MPFSSLTFSGIVGNIIFIWWMIYTFYYMYFYLFMSKNLFDQTYVYWVLEPTPNLSKFGHGLFILWCIPSIILDIILHLLYSLITGKPIDIYSTDKEE